VLLWAASTFRWSVNVLGVCLGGGGEGGSLTRRLWNVVELFWHWMHWMHLGVCAVSYMPWPAWTSSLRFG
jgi:hypothetical protein